ncbi:hypothetical protein PIB30_057499 [Stylosanthes scabra]|uniref:Transposase, Ptta/En/Spm, plant n=1 Tax=Stylosanthes scabra TaxID=79078 RepID=A0ABU6YM42_9FABA|nr:hypothetical protein [Stylosanthes scabra]
MPRKPRYKLPTTNDAVTAAQSDANLVGTMQGSTEYSSVQPHDVHKNTHSTGSGPHQAPSNVRRFLLPRNKVRSAHSTLVVVPQVPAARDYSRSRADMDDSDSGDPDYNPVADEVDSWEDHINILFEREEALNRDTEVRRRDTDNLKVNVIENGVMTPQNLTARQVFSLPTGRQRYFHFDVEDQNYVKKVILAKLGKIWKDTRGRLFHKFYDETKSLDENVQHRCPRGINPDHWRAFLEYRLEEDTLEKCRTNTANRAKQHYSHVGGSKTLARQREEEEKRHGRFFSRGEMWTVVHNRSDGSYIHDDAQAISEAIAEIESRDASTKDLSQKD